MAKIHKGAGDLLNIVEGTSATSETIRTFVLAQGEDIIHFSGEANERTVGNSVPRWVVVTNHALLVIPKSSIETGIFFDARTALETFSQAIVSDEDGAEVNLLQRSRLTNEAVVARSLVFPNVAVRKTFLLSLCIARASLPILQRRKLSPSAGAAILETPPSTTTNNRPTAALGTASGARSHASPPSRGALNQWVASSSPIRGPKDVTMYADPVSPPPKPPGVASEPIFDIADDVFSASRERLREILCDSWGDDVYDPSRTASRPPEEDPSRAAEREKVKADLDHREKKIIQNIEFRLKYPTKPPTKVQPGVEFDKAHEERMVLPDDLRDDELLGPALHSLWLEWKRCNGLMGHESSTGERESEWTLYSTNELIAALEEKEEELFGFVGTRCLKRVRNMRELVARERLMFLNSTSSKSPGKRGVATSTTPPTKIVPFHLSESPFSSLRSQQKLIEKHKIAAEMKAKYEEHLRVRHELQKQMMKRQIERLSPPNRGNDE